MANWPEVQGVENGQNVDASTFNPPLSSLATRTDYLKNRLDALGDLYSNIQVRVDASDLSVGDVVCIDPETKRYVRAVATMSLYDAFTASVRAFAVGVLMRKIGDEGVVILYGKTLMRNVDADAMTDEGVMVNGQYYLSSSTPGKITRFPKGPRVLVGFFAKNYAVNGDYDGAFAMVNPQHMDIEAHAHRTYVLKPRPAGEQETDDGVVHAVGRYPDGYSPEDSNDEPVFTGVPRLVVGGDYASDKEASYGVTVTNYEGGPASSWPCYVNWTAREFDEGSGRSQLRYFGEEAAIGTLGMTVRLAPSYGMSESSPVQTDSPPALAWTVDRQSSRGWSDCAVSAAAEFGSRIIAFGGYPDSHRNNLRVVVPNRVFDLESLPAEKGDTVEIDGEEFVFTDVDDTGVPEGSGAVRVLVGGSHYETMVALAGACDKVVYDEKSRQALCFADSVSGMSPAISNEYSVWFAVIRKDDGESVSCLHDGYSVSPVNVSWDRVPLNNGMDYRLIGSGSSAVGDTASVDVFFQVIGARYRYNIEFDNDLKKHFPPVPARSGSLMLNGVELDAYDAYGEPSEYAIGEDSLYWRDSSPGRQPWPASVPDVDAEDEYRLLFHFVSEFHSETGPVTSLRPADGAPITVRRCGTTDDATVGDLELDVDFTYGMSDMNVPGYRAVKASRNGKLLLGPVVERVVAGPGISLSRSAGVPDGQGTVVISADGAQYAGDFETVALENAKLESIGMFPYTRFLRWDPDNEASNIPTAFVAKFHVPATASYGVYRVKFYATVFGEESYSGADGQRVAGVTMDYNILPDYNSVNGSVVESANLKTGLIAPDSPFVLDVPLGTQGDDGTYSYDAYDPLLVHNDSSLDQIAGKSVLVMDHAFPTQDDCKSFCSQNHISGSVFGVKPGYTVSVRFSRSSPSGGTPYTGAIGFLNLRWSVEKVVDVVVSDDRADDLVRQTVLNLRREAQKQSRMDNSYDLVGILTRLLRALR